MKMKLLTIASLAALSAFSSSSWAACSGPPIMIPGNSAELEGEIRVKSGTSCSFGVSGIQGAISEVKILQMPKVGRAVAENLRAHYMAKPGYQGADEFTYVFIGTDQYGGPMRVVFKRKVTVVPNL
jgi:hypothetical protein